MRFLKFGLVGALIGGLACGAVPARASQAEPAAEAGTAQSATIPTVEAVLGHKSGTRISSHAQVMHYFKALKEAAPDRVSLHTYAKSWQGRALFYAVIASPDNLARMDDIKDGMQRLADPDGLSETEANRLIADLPGTVWLAHSVHGDEISSSDAAMRTAYRLLAEGDDPLVRKILADAVVIIDPLQNPDGRDRFVSKYYDTLGLEPAVSPIAAEHTQPWPGGRYNHYLFDMNRDWFVLTQPESRGRVQSFLEWMPLAFVDLHEMGYNSTYYFPPPAVPYNPEVTQAQERSIEIIGRTIGRHFDEQGLPYFTREVFDWFYPGYGEGWPTMHGSIGMTFEQASADGHVIRRLDGENLTYERGVHQHHTAAMATAEAVAENREALLRNFLGYRRSAVEQGRMNGTRSYIIPTQSDQAGADKLAGLLAMQGVEVRRMRGAGRACGAAFEAGSYVVPADQPAGRLVRTLLNAEAPLADDFLAEQERRRAKDLRPEIYDVTAWSLPLMFNLEVRECGEAVPGNAVPAKPAFIRPGRLRNANAAYGFLVPWGSAASVRFLAGALREGLVVHSPDESFVHDDVSYPAGTLILTRADNPGDLTAHLYRLAEQSGADVIGIEDAWVTEGPSFGSRKTVRHHPPNIAMAWDRPASPLSAGNSRFVIERQFGYPVTPVRTDDLNSTHLDRFDTLIMPSGNYASVLDKGDAEHIRQWVEDGGVLILQDDAVRFGADPEMGLLSIRRENAHRENGEAADEAEEPATVPGTILSSTGDFEEAVLPREESPDGVPGALVKAVVDPDHWLAAGVKPELNVLVRGGDIYTPVRRDQGTNVAHFARLIDLTLSGKVWADTAQQLAYKPFTVIEPLGRGYVIAFTQEPTVRAYLDGLNLIYANALFRAPARAARPR